MAVTQVYLVFQATGLDELIMELGVGRKRTGQEGEIKECERNRKSGERQRGDLASASEHGCVNKASN